MTDPLTNIADIIEKITTGKLTRIKLGPRFSRTILRYVDMADELFTPEQEDEAREWVREQLLNLARNTNIKWLPDWIETPIEELAVNLAVDLGWEIIHSSRLRSTLATGGVSAVK